MPELQTTTAASAASAAAAAATSSSLLAESSEQPSQHQNTPQNSNPFFNIISNFLKLFNFVPSPQKKNREDESAAKVSRTVDEVEAEAKPTVVRFPRHKDESLPSLKLEPDEIEERNTNPIVLWQVYAIGGFLVLRWAWTRWNERRTRKKPSNEEPPPAHD